MFNAVTLFRLLLLLWGVLDNDVLDNDSLASVLFHSAKTRNRTLRYAGLAEVRMGTLIAVQCVSCLCLCVFVCCMWCVKEWWSSLDEGWNAGHSEGWIQWELVFVWTELPTLGPVRSGPGQWDQELADLSRGWDSGSRCLTSLLCLCLWDQASVVAVSPLSFVFETRLAQSLSRLSPLSLSLRPG